MLKKALLIGFGVVILVFGILVSIFSAPFGFGIVGIPIIILGLGITFLSVILFRTCSKFMRLILYVLIHIKGILLILFGTFLLALFSPFSLVVGLLSIFFGLVIYTLTILGIAGE